MYCPKTKSNYRTSLTIVTSIERFGSKSKTTSYIGYFVLPDISGFTHAYPFLSNP